MLKNRLQLTGFTMIELMISLAIVGVLGSLSLAGFEYYKKKALRIEGADLTHAITVAQIQYRDRFSRYGNYSQLEAHFPNVVSENYAVTVTPVPGFEYQQYDADIRLNPNQTGVEENCVRYEVSARGGLITVRTFDQDGSDTSRSCLYR